MLEKRMLEKNGHYGMTSKKKVVVHPGSGVQGGRCLDTEGVSKAGGVRLDFPEKRRRKVNGGLFARA